MGNVPDVDLDDLDLESEIQLLAELIVAASETEGSLDGRTVDIVLGVRSPAHAAPGPWTGSPPEG